MAQHYKNESITKSRIKVFLGWEHFNPKGNVAPGRMDQNLCGRLWTNHDRSAVKLAVSSPTNALEKPTAEFLKDLDYRQAAIGESFGPTFSNHVFRLDITVPETMHNRPVHLLWDSNSEALILSENGIPRQGLVGGDHWARRADYPLFPDRPDSVAEKGDTILLYVEIACNGLFGAGRGGDIEPPDLDRFFKLGECCLAVFDPIAWALIHDVTLLSSLAEHLPEGSRRVQALQVANEVVNVVDVADPSTYQDGRNVAAEFLACHNGNSQSRVYSMLHSHIDLAWLWPMASTPAKGTRTFATHLRLMELYPECIFVQSQAQLYEWVKESHPALWDEICHRVREGRFVPVGGTWVEMDCNIPSGESLVRQFVVGQKFFQSNFGIRCKEFWLPDTFGYPAQLPQIMKGCGVDYFMTQKLSWNLFNKFPHSTFVWEGLDGSRVLAHMPPADTYNAQAFPEEVLRTANKNKDASVVNSAIMLVGHGDGGGGASPAMIESMRRMRDLDGIPKVEFSTPMQFFEEVRKKESDLPRWVGELYFELHRGTFTNQARTKQSNRQCENLLRDLELVGAHAIILGSAVGRKFDLPSELLETCWKLVLKNCFHDTLPGSCIPEVSTETVRDYGIVTEKCMEAIEKTMAFVCQTLLAGSDGENQATKRLKTGSGSNPASSLITQHGPEMPPLILVVRSTAWQHNTDRPLVIETIHSPDVFGTEVFVQSSRMSAITSNPAMEETRKPASRTLIALRSRPGGMGIVSNPSLVGREDVVANLVPATITTRQVNGETEHTLTNRLVEATISSAGHMKSVVLLDCSGERREALSQTASTGEPTSEGGNRLVVYDDVSQFWCAWDTEVYSYEKKKEVGAALSCDVIDEGSLRVGLHVKYPPTKAGSRIEQFITLRAESARVDFRTDVDWKENRKILRVLFNTQVRSSHASYNSQFGFVRRPTSFNHSWEIAKFEAVGHQYCDLSEHRFGVALLNDCKYGYSVRDSTMRLSLLRSSKSPDDTADMGLHRMTYSILPHWESFPTREVLEEAAYLNWPPLVKAMPPQSNVAVLRSIDHTFQFVVEGDHKGLDTVVISAVKQAEREPGAVVLRMYEAMGARGRALLRCPSGMKVTAVRECNMLEDIAESPKSDILMNEVLSDSTLIWIPFTPFKIRTIILHFNEEE